MRTLFQMFIVVLVMLAVFFLLRGMSKSDGKRKFKGPSLSKLRREIDKGELKKDPVSGTYVSTDDAIKVVKDGVEYYFVSQENADSFMKSEGEK